MQLVKFHDKPYDVLATIMLTFACKFILTLLPLTRSNLKTVTDVTCTCTCTQHVHSKYILPYPRERGPMGGAPYIRPRLGDGPIFEVQCISIAFIRERVPK